MRNGVEKLHGVRMNPIQRKLVFPSEGLALKWFLVLCEEAAGARPNRSLPLTSTVRLRKPKAPRLKTASVGHPNFKVAQRFCHPPSKRDLSDGQKRAVGTPLISLGASSGGKFVVSGAGEAYDARAET